MGPQSLQLKAFGLKNSVNDPRLSKIDLDEMKFKALEQYLSQAHYSVQSDEFQYDFLECCDRVLQDHFIEFLKAHPLPFLFDHPLRQQFAAQMDRLDDFGSQKSKPSIQPPDCLELLEEVEDPSQSWLLVNLFSPSLLRRLYADLEKLRWRSGEMTLDRLRHSFDKLLRKSLILEGEESARLRMKIQHGGILEVLYLLHRFLSAHLEYAQVIQALYFQAHPELPRLLWRALLKEVPKALK